MGITTYVCPCEKDFYAENSEFGYRVQSYQRDSCYISSEVSEGPQNNPTKLRVLKERSCFATVNTGAHTLFFLPPGDAAVE